MSVNEALWLMLNGDAEQAIELLEADGMIGEDPRAKPALGCAYAIIDKREQAERMLAADQSELDEVALAIDKTGRAYLAANDGDIDKFVELMRLATQLDPALPLPWLSLGLYYQRNGIDFDKARSMYKRALEIAPNSYLVLRHLMGLEASDGNVGRAWRLYRRLPSTKGPKPWIFPVTLAVTSTPLGGGLLVLALVVFSFLPYGPFIVTPMWLGLTLLSFHQLRSISGRLAILPAFGLVSILSGLVLRWLILGRILP